ncbi:MAG TPA: hypothetical protein EYM60_08030 [Candidatus Marinimicrobia bacterium]|jgi:hypothetical protein|nr:hypothetical protein [Candidatus Neomarinimicrobiota bacterium]HIN03268.1 hypothetical protein [Candidatus Neomarinimicrobiota bacterium]
MMKYILSLILLTSVWAQDSTPADFWNDYSQEEKIAFINGAYGAIAKLKSHHRAEVRKQFLHKNNWVEPYYIERFYEITDEYRSQEVGYNLKIIALHMDAFYSNSDNLNIPVMEALRVVSLMQDGEQKKANVRLLRAQHKYN